jgi:Dienelactone hydrolase family
LPTTHRCEKRKRPASGRAILMTLRVRSNALSIVLFGGQDRTSTFPIQVKTMESFHANGQSLEWHYFHFGNHGFASTESDGYQPYLADLACPLVMEFLGRELVGRPAL